MKFADFAPLVQSEAPGAPIFAVERAVRDAAIELWRQSDVWQAEPDNLRMIPGVISYELSAGQGIEINRVLDIHRNGVPLTKLGGVRDIYEKLGNDETREEPRWFSANDNTGVIVARRPAVAENLTLFLSLKPDASSTSIPDTIGREYRKQIATGAKANLLLMNAQPWSNPQLGLMFEQQFQRNIAAIIRQTRFGFSGASLRVKSRPFV